MALADAGGILTWTEFDGSTRNNFIEGLTTTLLMAGWSLAEEVFASVTGGYASNPTNGQQVTAGYQTYTFVTALGSTPNEVLIGGSLTATLTNLVAAVNLGFGAGSQYSSTTPINPIIQATTTGSDVTFTFRFAGPMGNSTPTTFGVTAGGGFKLDGQSPQLQSGSSSQLGVRASIYDRGFTNLGNNYANARILSQDESIESSEHFVAVGAGQTFRCVANQAQFFCYVPGSQGNVNGTVLCAGVPWIAPASACSGDVPQLGANFAFWVSNDYAVNDGGSNVAGTTPRSVTVGPTGNQISDTDQLAQVVVNTGADTNNWIGSDAAYNASVTLGDFQLVTMAPSFPISGSLIDSMRWHGGNGTVGRRMLLEPLTAWASGDAAPIVTGQLYNSWIGTDQVPMDTVQQFSDSNYYVAFTNNCKFGTLWLQVPGPEPLLLEAVSFAH